MSHPIFAQNRPTRRLSKSGTLFIDHLSPEFAPVPLKIRASHARLLITPDEFLYPLRGVRRPCYRICYLSESFHPVPYGNDDRGASHNHCRVYQKAKEYECFHIKLNLLNFSLHSSFSSECNRLKNPPERLFLPFVRQKATKFRVGRSSAKFFLRQSCKNRKIFSSVRG
jgi:hypothetical protein